MKEMIFIYKKDIYYMTSKVSQLFGITKGSTGHFCSVEKIDNKFIYCYKTLGCTCVDFTIPINEIFEITDKFIVDSLL